MSVHRIPFGTVLLLMAASGTQAEDNGHFRPDIPKVWDVAALKDQEIPVVVPKYSPKPFSADYYYKIPVRTIYKSYPIYAPGRAPAGYLEKLSKLEPEVAFDSKKLRTKEDWIRAGELVFEAPVAYNSAFVTPEMASDPKWYAHTGVRLTADGIMPYARYVVRERGKVDVGNLSCSMCHTRVLGDGTVVKAGPGNFPFDNTNGYLARRQPFEQTRYDFLGLFSVPWIPERQRQFEGYGREEIATIFDSIPMGVLARNRSSPFFPPAVPDLRGVRDRHYLDKTALNQNRGIVSLMRYAAMAEGLEFFLSFDGFIPSGGSKFDTLPPPESLSRFSEEQLYALAMWLSSLDPITNPDPPPYLLSTAGKKIFDREGCSGCHTPPLYTSNKITPAKGFSVPQQHKAQYDIALIVVGTDPTLTMETRRGTGYYKVPPLRGVWYRGPFEHNGSVATLEDWFDPSRLRDDYLPTGFKGYGIQTRAVKGHEFGLRLTSEERKALIAFLRTL
jgi:hypothetical protein